MSGTFSSLLVVEAILTGIVGAMFLWRGVLDMQEEDRLILDDAEAHLGRNQAAIRQRVTSLSRYITMVGAAWGVLGALILGLWVVQGLRLI